MKHLYECSYLSRFRKHHRGKHGENLRAGQREEIPWKSKLWLVPVYLTQELWTTIVTISTKLPQGQELKIPAWTGKDFGCHFATSWTAKTVDVCWHRASLFSLRRGLGNVDCSCFVVNPRAVSIWTAFIGLSKIKTWSNEGHMSYVGWMWGRRGQREWGLDMTKIPYIHAFLKSISKDII